MHFLISASKSLFLERRWYFTILKVIFSSFWPFRSHKKLRIILLIREICCLIFTSSLRACLPTNQPLLWAVITRLSYLRSLTAYSRAHGWSRLPVPIFPDLKPGRGQRSELWTFMSSTLNSKDKKYWIFLWYRKKKNHFNVLIIYFFVPRRKNWSSLFNWNNMLIYFRVYHFVFFISFTLIVLFIFWIKFAFLRWN